MHKSDDVPTTYTVEGKETGQRGSQKQHRDAHYLAAPIDEKACLRMKQH